MGDGGSGGPVVTETAGVAVRKRAELGEYWIPAIVIEVASTLDRPARVRITESVPEEVDTADLEFHPDYGRSYWEAEDGELTFERTLSPHETYRTVYGVVSGSEADVRALKREDTAVDVDPDTGGSGGIKPDRTDVHDDASGTARETSVEEQQDRQARVLDRLVAEVREGSLTPDQRAALRELFDGGDVDAPLEARVAHLQNQLADLQAYTDALEAFLAEQGSGEDAIGRLADLEASVNSLEASVADHGERLDALAQNLESVHAAVEDVESDIEDMSHTWEQLRRLFRSEDAITQ
jgi:hypothetical protein